MTLSLPNYLITINGKPFIKDGDVPDIRVDIEYKKPKLKRCKMCVKQEKFDEFAEELQTKINTAFPGLDKDKLKEIIWGQGHRLVC